MKQVRLTKISGDKLIKVISTKGNRTENYIEGYVGDVYSNTPTVGYPFGVYNNELSFRTSPVLKILSSNTFKTKNSIYKWEIMG